MSGEMEVDSDQTHIDEGLYSRQLFIMGHDSMQKMMKCNVLIIGLSGLGVEIAKNVILTGVKSVTLYDNEMVNHLDLASNFYVSPNDVNLTSRANASKNKLLELNPYVGVSVYDGSLDESFLLKFNVIVLTNSNFDEQKRINTIAHNNRIKFICADIRGVFASAFIDFGSKFEVYDTNGESPASYMIDAITKDTKGVVTVVEESRIDFRSEYVVFSEIEGMTELNDQEPIKIDVTGPFTFTINDTNSYNEYKKGGYVTEVKIGEVLNFLPLEEAIKKPKIEECDFKDLIQRHIAFLALHEFRKENGRLPQSYNKQDAELFIKCATTVNNSCKFTEKLDEDLLTKFSYTAMGNISPMAAFLGGVIAQEVLKSCTGKFKPIHQFLYFDAIESLPDNINDVKCELTNSRYDGQIAVYGNHINNLIQQQKYFLVGAGAIGCEMLKNWAMMGLGTKGAVFVTDMDTIERSNLNRQFLFRTEDIEELKSETAANAVLKMNPELNITAYSERVGPETESTFSEQFYSNLTGVCNALDNVAARMYMDQKCVENRLSLLESGTLGTKGNTQVIVPYLTESYGSSADPPEKSIPMCTLHHFPSRIEHTIQWARDTFQGLFYNVQENVNGYLTQENFLDNLKKQNVATQLDIISGIHSALVTERAYTFEDCITWARFRFEEFFNNTISQLLYNFPKDLITSNGTPFWSGAKRAPSPITFDINNPLHFNFILAAANLRAVNFNLKGTIDGDQIKNVIKNISVPEFKPKSNISIPANDEEAKKQKESGGDVDENKIKHLLSELPDKNSLVGFRLTPIEFEKDDDSNFHIDFITNCSNLRATNYSITIADRHKTKGIAGKIIPAMVTTTAMVTGLVCIELIKMIQKKKIEDYKNSFCNLALPLFTFSEPLQPEKVKIRDGWEWSLWDRFDIKGPKTLGDIITEFETKHKLEVSMVSGESTLLYGFYMKPQTIEERKKMEIGELYAKLSKKAVTSGTVTLILCCSKMEDGKDVDIPSVLYRL